MKILKAFLVLSFSATHTGEKNKHVNSVSDQMCAFLPYSGQDVDLLLANICEVYGDQQHEHLAPYNVNSRIAVLVVVGAVEGRGGGCWADRQSCAMDRIDRLKRCFVLTFQFAKLNSLVLI